MATARSRTACVPIAACRGASSRARWSWCSGNTRAGRYGDGGGYTPQVTYRYVVDGAELTSNKLAAAVRGYKRAIAERKLEEIPDAVVVW